jgi:hypothetical protein
MLNILTYWHKQYVLFYMAYAMMKSLNFSKFMLRQPIWVNCFCLPPLSFVYYRLFDCLCASLAYAMM